MPPFISLSKVLRTPFLIQQSENGEPQTNNKPIYLVLQLTQLVYPYDFPLLTQSGSFALSEVGSGSDAFALKSTATRGNGCWILNGQKAWIRYGLDFSPPLTY